MTNALLAPWTTAFALPPFDLIRDDDFAPAFDQGLAEARAAIAAIADNPAPASFANTIDALELADVGLRLERWLGEGSHGSMEWMEVRKRERQVPSVHHCSVVSFGMQRS